MKLSIKLSFYLFFICNLTFSQDWIKTDISDFASIDFPVVSELTETQEEIVFTANDDFAFYLVSLRKLTEKQSSQIIKHEIPDLYRGFIDGAMKAANAELVSINEIKINNITAIELEYYASPNQGLPRQRFKRVIYINQHIISIDFWPITDVKDIANNKKKMFFNSFSLESDKIEDPYQDSLKSTKQESFASKIGRSFGEGLAYLTLLGLLVAIIFLFRFLIKKLRKKKPSPNPLNEQPQTKIVDNICGNCETENSSNSKYCKQCGFELSKK